MVPKWTPNPPKIDQIWAQIPASFFPLILQRFWMVFWGAWPSIWLLFTQLSWGQAFSAMSEKVSKMTTQNAPKHVPKPFQNHQKNNPKTKPANMTKKCRKVAPAGAPLGSLLAPLARLWAPLGLNWSSVWLPFAPPASSNGDCLANSTKWSQNKLKMEPKLNQIIVKWIQN